MSNIQVTNIKNLSGNNTVAITSTSGELIVKNNLIAEDGVNVSGVCTATSFSGSLSAGQLTGTVADARISTLTASKLSGDLPAISGASLTTLNASELDSGTIPDARFPATLPTSSGVNLTGVVTSIVAGLNITLTSGATGIVTIAASGGGGASGVVVKNNGVAIGSATTINFGTNLDVSSLVGGAVTVTSPNDNTTYTLPVSDDGSGNAQLTLTDSDSLTDQVLLTAGTNISFSSFSAGGFTINRDETAGINTSGTTELNNLDITGVATATSFSGSLAASNLTGALPSLDGSNIIDSRWSVGADGSSNYTFTGPGGLSSANDPTIYLARGRTYEFNVDASGHPFHIQTSSGAYNASNLYTTGVTNPGAAVGVIKFSIPFSAPNTLYYVCQNHSSMAGTIVIYPSI